MFYYYSVIIIFFIFIAIFTLISGIYGAPSIPTPKKVVKKMVSLMDIKRGKIYYDLGSGDGRILEEIAHKKGLAIGFEYAPLIYAYSKFIFLFKKNKKNIKIFWKNFWKKNLKNASGIFCFLSPNAMANLEKKFKKELKNGTKVISYAFKMPNKKPQKIIKIKNYAPIYVYKY